LLNAIDGVAAGEGRILFLTTNHPEKLDPALIRPGRCDIRKTIGHPDYTQILRLWNRFYTDAPASLGIKFASGVKTDISMAALQGHFSKYRTAGEALANINEVTA